MDLEHVRVAQRGGELSLAVRRHQPVLRVDDDRGRDVDVADPRAAAEAPEGGGGGDERAGLVAAQLGERPSEPLPAAGEYRDDRGRERAWAERQAGGERSDRPEPQSIGGTAAEVTRGRGEHETGDEIGVAEGEELRDRTAHGVADDDRRPAVEPTDQRGGVVRAVGEAEAIPAPGAATVAAVVERGHERLVGQALVAAFPVERARRAEAVEQHDWWRRPVVTRGPHEHAPVFLELHMAPSWHCTEWSVDQGRSRTHRIGLPAAVKGETDRLSRRGYLARIDAGLHIETQRENGELVVKLVGELDLAASTAFGDAVELAMTSSPRVIVDAADLTFIDSSGVNALVRAQRRASDAAVELVVRAPDRRVRTVLEITGVDALLAIEP